MNAETPQALQERIHRAIERDEPQPKSYLAFQVAANLWVVEFSQVSTVMTCGHITRLWSGYGMPRSVVGISTSGEEILTVIDAGLVLGARPVVVSLKSRMLTFTTQHLRGIALLVDRVLDPLTAEQLSAITEPYEHLDVGAISQKINLGVAK